MFIYVCTYVYDIVALRCLSKRHVLDSYVGSRRYSTEEHPADTYFKALLERERAKRHPYISIQTKYFTQPVAHFRNDEGGARARWCLSAAVVLCTDSRDARIQP